MPRVTIPRHRRAAPKGTKRSILKHSKAAERKAADYINGFRLPSVGAANQPDAVSYAPNGIELLAVEVKHRAITRARKDAMRQAQLAARGRRGSPIPALCEIDKAGQGRQDGLDLITFLASDWLKLVERLSNG